MRWGITVAVERAIIVAGVLIAGSILVSTALVPQQRYAFQLSDNGGAISLFRVDTNTGQICVYPAGAFTYSPQRPAPALSSENPFSKYLTPEERAELESPVTGPEILRPQAAKVLPRIRPEVTLPTCY